VGGRDLDVVVFGATGITGRNVAAYLAERAPETGATWAAAARDTAKLDRVLGEIGVSAPETIVADVRDPASLAAMASRARVVLNLVGPYTHYGRPVIEACVAHGAHYADVSGEMPFVRRIIDAFDASARTAGIKVVQVCGFESIPPDLSVQLAAERARERWGEGLADVDLQLRMKPPPGLPRASDMSGGTLQTFAAVAGGEDATRINDPAALVSDEGLADQIRRRSPIAFAPRRDTHGAVIAPMIPAPFINPAVIHRTTALLGAENGGRAEPFRYREGTALDGNAASLPLRFAAAYALAGPQAMMRSLAQASAPVRRRVARAMERILPSSGFGPTGERLEQWEWRMTIVSRTGAGHEVRVEVESEGHVGFLATARMLGEAGLLLAEPGATPERTGCLTPATALGTASVERFERARLHFAVTEAGVARSQERQSSVDVPARG
jgi:short subunit dehydrogenase-like uncharacterized protein